MWIANRIPRFLCAGILLVAAGLKAYELVTDPALGTLYGSRWLQLLLTEYEVLLASWLLVGAAQHACRLVALVTFAAFACYALYLGMSGAASCGCFGGMQVNPWWTFALDGAAMWLLWRWEPTAFAVRICRLASAAAFPVVVGGMLVALVTMQPQTVLADGIEVTDSFVVLEPEKWVGKRFPLSRYVDIGERLSTGSWTVVLYHHDCPMCQEAIRWYDSLAEKRLLDGTAGRTVFVELPPYGPMDAFSFNGRVALTRLGDAHQWFAATPAAVMVEEGIVVGYLNPDEVQLRITRWQ